MAKKFVGFGFKKGVPSIIYDETDPFASAPVDPNDPNDPFSSAPPPLPATNPVNRQPPGEDPADYPLPLTPLERQTVSGELVAGPATGGRLPPTPEAAMPAMEPGETQDEWTSKLPVISVSKPPAPIVEATIMKRGMPGSGASGENLDLTPTRFTRQNAMTLEEAQAAGMIIPSTPAPSFRQVGRAPTGPNAGMGMSGEAERASLDSATRSERWGQAGSTTRSQGRVSAIVDQIRATRTARDQSKIRSDEAMRTPQLATGTYVGQAFVPDGKGGGSVQTVDATTGGGNRSPKPMTPAQAANILKQAAQMRAGDKLKAISPDPDTADALENMLRAQGYDVDALKGGGQKTEVGGQRSEGGGQRSEVRGQRSEGGGQSQPAAKPKYAEGQTGMLKGVPHVYKGGRWVPA